MGYASGLAGRIMQDTGYSRPTVGFKYDLTGPASKSAGCFSSEQDAESVAWDSMAFSETPPTRRETAQRW